MGLIHYIDWSVMGTVPVVIFVSILLCPVNYGVLLLQALLEHWPETHYSVPLDDGGDQESSGGMTGSRANSPAGQ